MKRGRARKTEKERGEHGEEPVPCTPSSLREYENIYT